VGHSVSHIIDTRQRKILVNQDYLSYQREFVIAQRTTYLEHIGGKTVDLAVFDINRSEVMVRRKRADERSNRITQTHGGK